MKILITGAMGMLGRDLTDELREDHRLILADKEDTAGDYSRHTALCIDLTDPEALSRAISAHHPDIVIHAAAYTDVDGCQKDPQKAFFNNGIATRHTALACGRTDTPIVYFSTDYVFDGSKEAPYTETDMPQPLNVYGESKWWGELFVQWMTQRFFIVRTSWLFGKYGKNFVRSVLERAKKHEVLKIVNDQTGNPTYSRDLAGAVRRLISSQAYGIYHITNSGSVSWYGFAKDILAEAGIEAKVLGITSEELERPAPRPRNSVLENRRWKAAGYDELPHYKEALSRYIKEI